MDAVGLGAAYAVALVLAMPLLVRFGQRLGRRQLKHDADGSRAGITAVEGVVFGLLGLMIAFTFSGALRRFDDRRELVTREANAISGAWLRLDLLPEPAQPPLRALLRDYLDARIQLYEHLLEKDVAAAARSRATALQGELWKASMAAWREAGSPLPAALLFPALNDMFDIATTRWGTLQIHPPLIVYLMLGALLMAVGLLIGYDLAGTRAWHWGHILGFSILMAFTFYVIIDLEYPRQGIWRVTSSDTLLLELRETMK